MANKHKGEIDIQAGDDEYTFVLDLNAIIELEEAFDTSADKIGEVIGTRISHLRTVFRIGLSRHHPELSDRDVGEIMTAIGAGRAGEIIGEAFALSFPESRVETTSGNGRRASKH